MNTPSAPCTYNATTMAKRSTEWLEDKVAELTEAVQGDAGKRPRAYYAQMAIEQRARSLGIYSAALADRRAGLI